MKYLICKNKNIIFGINPKCGCQHIHFIFNYLHNDNDKPVFYHKTDEQLSNEYLNYKLIIFVRNPYERIVSGFKEKYSNEWQKKNYLKKYSIPGIQYDKLTFRQFVNELYNNKFKYIDKHHFDYQNKSKYDFSKHKDIVVYDIKNIDYNYLSELFNKNITNHIKQKKGNHTNTDKDLFNEPVYDLENMVYREYNVSLKYYFDSDIKRKVDEIYHDDFVFLNKYNIDTSFPY